MKRLGILVLAVALGMAGVGSSTIDARPAQTGPIWFATGLLLGSASNSDGSPTTVVRPAPSCNKPIMVLRAFGVKPDRLRINFTSTLEDSVDLTVLNIQGYPLVQDRWMRPLNKGSHWVFRQTEIRLDKRFGRQLTIIAIVRTNKLCRLAMEIKLKPPAG
jgi:hypothetical protein